MKIFVIYESASDYPGQFVVRRWDVGPGFLVGEDLVAATSTLAAARNAIPLGLVRIQRHEYDDPVIVEVWL